MRKPSRPWSTGRRTPASMSQTSCCASTKQARPPRPPCSPWRAQALTARAVPQAPPPIPMDNHWVVPYNRTLSLMFNAHINVEVVTSIPGASSTCTCTSTRALTPSPTHVDAATGARVAGASSRRPGARHAVACACGSPRALCPPCRAAPVDFDEIRRFLQGRYVSSSEAFWRLFGFAMHAAAPNIVRLQVRLPSQNLVFFPAELPP